MFFQVIFYFLQVFSPAKIPPLKLFCYITFPNGYSKEPPNLNLHLISRLLIKSSVGSLIK